MKSSLSNKKKQLPIAKQYRFGKPVKKSKSKPLASGEIKKLLKVKDKWYRLYKAQNESDENSDLDQIKRAYKEIPPKENTDFKNLIASMKRAKKERAIFAKKLTESQKKSEVPKPNFLQRLLSYFKIKHG